METWRATEGAKYGIGSNIILLKMLTVILRMDNLCQNVINLIRFMTSIFFYQQSTILMDKLSMDSSSM